MKKAFLVLGIIIVLVCIAIFAFKIKNQGKTSNVIISIGETEKFSKFEIQEAINCVLKEFRNHYRKCNLTKLWYDEKESNRQIESYVTKSSVRKENIIILFSDFHVGFIDENVGNMYPNTDEHGWNWILIRDEKTSKWRIHDRGY